MPWKKRPKIELNEAVLIVDDEADIVEYIAFVVETMGIPTVKTSNPTEAAALFETHKPFLVISDFRMPGMTGLDLCQAIRALNPQTPFVLYTAFADRNTVLSGLRMHVDDLLEKPCAEEQIYNTIEKFAKKRLAQLDAERSETDALSNIYIEEAQELLAGLDKLILRLEEEPMDEAVIDLIFRKVHTIKGGSGAIAIARELGSLCHEFESSLTQMRQGRLARGSLAINSYLEVAELCHTLLGFLKTRSEPDAATLSKSEDAKKQLRSLPSSVATPPSAPHSPAPTVAPVAAPSLSVVPSTKASTVEIREHDEEGLWVSNDALDQLVSMLGEFVVLKNQVELLMRDQKLFSDAHRSQKKLKEISTRTGKIADKLQTNIMAIRKIRLDKALGMLPRICRQVSGAVNKNVKFSMKGLDFGVDKGTGKTLAGALSHLIRNSIDHGIESAEERTAAGKAAAGSVEVTAFEKAGEVHLILSDDGRGIDPERVAAKARDKGLITAEKAQQLSKEEAYELLFLPGFSTAEKVTDISGRGVGMDAVRTSLLELHGRISMSSEKGKGTRFELIIPVTRSIAVEKTILVRSDDTLIAIPLANLATLVAREDLILSHMQGRDVVLFQGQSVPLYDYYSLIGRQHLNKDKNFAYALFIKHNDEILAFKAQAIVGHLDAVIRPFDEVVKALPAFKGTTILGDEKVAYILSAEECLNLVRKQRAA